MKMYGLQLKVKPSQHQKMKKKPTKPPLSTHLLGGLLHDYDDDDVEKEISSQANKNKTLKKIEEQHKRALEEDPLVFDYDGVYDQMKEEVSRPRVLDRQELKPQYIDKMIANAKEREREHEIINDRIHLKLRHKEDHLYPDKDEYVTVPYRNKLAAEQANEEDKEKNKDVTKKRDMSDFYSNLANNVAFGGAKGAKSRKPETKDEKMTAGASEVVPAIMSPQDSFRVKEANQGETSTSSSKSLESLHAKPLVQSSAQDTPVMKASKQEKSSVEQVLADQPKSGHHKRNGDDLYAATERFLARKKAKELFYICSMS